MQQARRRDPYPMTWELPALAAMGVGLALVLGVHAGRAVANLVSGNGWAMPARVDLFSSLPGVFSGDPTAGVTGLTGAGASPTTLTVCVVVTEIAVLVACGWVLKTALDRWGPKRLRGVASRAEAERLLGPSRLRKAAPLVRPDLYGKHSSPNGGRR